MVTYSFMQKAEAELHKHMYVQDIKDLQLDEHNKIGYTYKALGAGFWALRQKDFRKALETIVFEVIYQVSHKFQLVVKLI